MPTLELVNEEMVNDSGHESFSNGINQVRVSVNGLTASWTHVSLYILQFFNSNLCDTRRC